MHLFNHWVAILMLYLQVIVMQALAHFLVHTPERIPSEDFAQGLITEVLVIYLDLM